MEKEIRKSLCKKCLKAVQKVEAKLMRVRRIKIKQTQKQESGKVTIKQ